MQKEDIQIVNENDEVIGAKPRNEVAPEDIYRVAALWITNSHGDVLLAQRKLTKIRDPGKWGPAVAGTIEKGETYEENICREAEEEFGVTRLTFQLGPKQRRRGIHNHFTQWFLLTLDRPAGSFTIQEEEVEKIAWMPGEKIKEELATNPDKYIPSMPEIAKLFLK